VTDHDQHARRTDDVSLRDHLEAAIQAQSTEMVAAIETVEKSLGEIRSILTQRLDLLDRAREVEAAEYARRLEKLNHSYERAEIVLQTYLPRDMFEQSQREFRTWRETITTDLAATRGRAAAYTIVIGFIFTLLIAVLRFVPTS